MANSLKNSYFLIGNALLQFESDIEQFGPNYSLAFNELREELVFTPVELLEAYLEDLLNMKISDQNLFIAPEACRWKNIRCQLWIAAFVLALAGLLIFMGFSLSWAALVTLLSCLPLIGLASLAPLKLKRRMLFARALSREIARRRGRDDDASRNAIAIRDFFIKPASPGLPGAARFRYH